MISTRRVAVAFFLWNGLALWAQQYVVSTVAGGGLPESIAGASASIRTVARAAVDRSGNVYFTLNHYHVVLKLDAATGTLTRVAGTGIPGFAGDNGPATSSRLNQPLGVAVDADGSLYIADTSNQRIRKVVNGVITTVAGNGMVAFGGDSGSATSTPLENPSDVAVDSTGNIFITEPDNPGSRIRKVSNGVMTTVAGNGTAGFSGDNGPATSAQLNAPAGIALDPAGNLYIADAFNNRIRKVSNGTITTIAGNGNPGFGGDNGPATSAQLSTPLGVAVDSAGNVFISDRFADRIRLVSNGVMTTFAGGGSAFGSSLGDGGLATNARLSEPSGIAVSSTGSIYIVDARNNRVRKVSNGVITTVAGGGDTLGDNGPATNAQLSEPWGVAVDNGGNLFIADTYSHRVRKVSNGVITTVAGNGGPSFDGGFGGDSGPATDAKLAFPNGLAVDATGKLYIADTGNNRIRLVSNGVITTVAGGADRGLEATMAQLRPPSCTIRRGLL